MRKVLLAIMAMCVLVAGCSAKPTPNPALALPEVTIGVAGVTQPKGTSELLAGFIPDNRTIATEKAVMEFDTALMSLIRAQSGASRTFRFIPAASPSLAGGEGSRLTALRHWINVGKQSGVDMLIVPQILNWHEREGSAAGAVSSAEIVVNFFLIDVVNGSLLQRSHFAEKQQSLSSDLLSAGTFFKRGAKWLTAQELADEAVAKMVKEFGL